METSVRLFNTQTKQKQIVVPQNNNDILLYTCGPTIYNYAHIGNFRTYVFEDLLRRTLSFFKFKVTQVMNLTDVDDKTIKGALHHNLSLKEYTDIYKKAFFEDLNTLKIQPAEHYPAATDYIPQMIVMIQTLLEKEIAYQTPDGNVYFSIEKFPSYGTLSHFCLHDLKNNASERVENDEYEKESISDFVLWKAWDPSRDGHIFWESPFGKGRPGWHIECSAMASSLLGPTLDIHVGGVDNMFPHHENEIAQSEACFGQRFVNLWLHAEHLVVNGKKMSKSAGNFYTLRDLIQQGFNGTEVRFLLLQTHYRTQLNFTLEGLQAAKSALSRLNDFIYRLQHHQGEKKASTFSSHLNAYRHEFCEHLADDLNISPALAVIFNVIREAHLLMDQNSLTTDDQKEILDWLLHINHVLDIMNFDQQLTIEQELQDLLEQRQQARKEKNWKESDRIRDLILSRGFLIEDSSQGARLKKITDK